MTPLCLSGALGWLVSVRGAGQRSQKKANNVLLALIRMLYEMKAAAALVFLSLLHLAASSSFKFTPLENEEWPCHAENLRVAK